jgi:hypothetical protein
MSPRLSARTPHCFTAGEVDARWRLLLRAVERAVAAPASAELREDLAGRFWGAKSAGAPGAPDDAAAFALAEAVITAVWGVVSRGPSGVVPASALETLKAAAEALALHLAPPDAHAVRARADIDG